MIGIQGITVTLITDKQTGTDEFGTPIVEQVEEDVENVLVAPTSSADNVDNMSLYGRMAAYTLAIPKGDSHDWTNAHVRFFGKEWRTLGIPTKGIDADTPTEWNEKVQVELYE